MLQVLDARREAGELSPVFADEGGLLKASQASFPAYAMHLLRAFLVLAC